MRASILDRLRCPDCLESRLALEVEGEDDFEIRGAVLRCPCGGQFVVRRGVVDLRPGVVARDTETTESDEWDPDSELPDAAYLLNAEAILRNLSAARADRFKFGTPLNLDFAIEQMSLDSDKFVLDVGAGVTWTTSRLAEADGFAVALDARSEVTSGLGAAEVFLRHHHKHYERILGQLESLPFSDAVFDHVLFHDRLHAIADIDSAVREAARVLRPGGSIWLVNEPVSSYRGVFDGESARESRLAGGAGVKQLGDYLSACRKAGCKPSVYYPPSLSARLQALHASRVALKPSSRGQALKYRLVSLGLGFWQVAVVRTVFEKHLYRPALALFGQQLLLEAKKP